MTELEVDIYPIESAGWLRCEQLSWLAGKLHEFNIDMTKFARVFGVEYIDQIQREHINRAVLLIELIREGASK